jgi:hypothetical protein
VRWPAPKPPSDATADFEKAELSGSLVIIYGMRAIVLLLMIALLPLRMWAADGMALRMAHAEMVAMDRPDMAQTAMPDDCPMMAKASGSTDVQDSSSPTTHASCLTCQLCAALATGSTGLTGRHAQPVAPPDRASRRFASADPLQELKPPIS